MMVLQNIAEVKEEGLAALLGKHIEVFCGNYIYAGRLVGVNTICIKLEDPYIVYETGELNAKKFKNAQTMGKTYHYLMCGFIESFGETNKLV